METKVSTKEEKQTTESAVQVFADLLVLLIEENNKTDTDSIKNLLDNMEHQNGAIIK